MLRYPNPIVWSWPYTALMCGNPVTHLTVHHIKAGDVQGILRDIRRSTRDLTHLELGINEQYAPSPTSAICAGLVRHIPSLRYLKISLRPLRTHHISEEPAHSISVLKDLPLLEEFVCLGGSPWSGHTVSWMKLGNFSSLRRVILSRRARVFGHVWEDTKYFIKEPGDGELTEISRHEYELSGVSSTSSLL